MNLRLLISCLILVFLSAIVACEKEDDLNDGCYGCSSSSNAIVEYKDIQTSFGLIRSGRFEKIDNINLGSRSLSLSVYFEDSLLSIESIAQKIPFYLKINSLKATPPSQTFYFVDDQIDSIKFTLIRFSLDSIIEKIDFTSRFEFINSNISPRYFSSIDSLVYASQNLSDFEYKRGNMVRNISMFVPNEEIKDIRGTIQFVTQVFVNETKTLLDSTQKVLLE